MTGPIPTELGGLTRLESLDLGGSELTGPIPPELGGLTQLEELNLARNNLSGLLPRSLLQLDRLRHFFINGNESLCIPGIRVFDVWLQGLENWDGLENWGGLWVLCNATDLEILRSLFETVGGERWTRSDGWMADHTPGEWYGVNGGFARSSDRAGPRP